MKTRTSDEFYRGKIKLGIIIPTRGNERPRFLENCMRQIKAQTLQPTGVLILNGEPESNAKDITKRYKQGYNHYNGKGYDLLALWEDDEFYAPDYLETMVATWRAAGEPELFGTTYTIYYNIRLFAHFTRHHHQMSSAMSTLIKPDMDFTWCPDSEPFTDVHLWSSAKHKDTGKLLTRALYTPDHHICIGMKHGVGLTGGNSHVCDTARYMTGDGRPDPNKNFLRAHTTPESYEFFANYFLGAK